VSFNGKQLFEVDDSTFTDAVTLFDEVTYGETE
jgi:hypothetical protein